MDFQNLIKLLQQRLKEPLPAENAHSKMAAQHRTENFSLYKPNQNTKEGGVLVLLYPHENQAHLALIQRSTTERGVHKGQISLPGGKKEDTDTDLTDTALRETLEEIGVQVPRNQVIGLLTEIFIFASNFMVTPVVAFLEEKPSFLANIQEVEEVLEISVEHLAATENQKTTNLLVAEKYELQAPYFDVHNKIVWGATAMIISELTMVFLEIKENYFRK